MTHLKNFLCQDLLCQDLTPHPVEVSGKDRVAHLNTLRQQMGMFATDGMMPVDGAKNEWQVLADFNSQYGNVLPEKTYTNHFVIQANRH